MPLRDLSDPAGPRDQMPYLSNIIEIQGQPTIPPASPAGGSRPGVDAGDTVKVDPLSSDLTTGTITRTDGTYAYVRP